MNRPWPIAIVFILALAVVLAGLALTSATVLRLDAAELQARGLAGGRGAGRLVGPWLPLRASPPFAPSPPRGHPGAARGVGAAPRAPPVNPVSQGRRMVARDDQQGRGANEFQVRSQYVTQNS